MQINSIFERTSDGRIILSKIVFTVIFAHVIGHIVYDCLEVRYTRIGIRAESNLKNSIQCVQHEVGYNLNEHH